MHYYLILEFASIAIVVTVGRPPTLSWADRLSYLSVARTELLRKVNKN
jgi:hypothetical protein